MWGKEEHTVGHQESDDEGVKVRDGLDGMAGTQAGAQRCGAFPRPVPIATAL